MGKLLRLGQFVAVALPSLFLAFMANWAYTDPDLVLGSGVVRLVAIVQIIFIGIFVVADSGIPWGSG